MREIAKALLCCAGITVAGSGAAKASSYAWLNGGSVEVASGAVRVRTADLADQASLNRARSAIRQEAARLCEGAGDGPDGIVIDRRSCRRDALRDAERELARRARAQITRR